MFCVEKPVRSPALRSGKRCSRSGRRHQHTEQHGQGSVASPAHLAEQLWPKLNQKDKRLNRFRINSLTKRQCHVVHNVNRYFPKDDARRTSCDLSSEL